MRAEGESRGAAFGQHGPETSKWSGDIKKPSSECYTLPAGNSQAEGRGQRVEGRGRKAEGRRLIRSFPSFTWGCFASGGAVP
jgi:hypothetical protein